jgi:NADPH2:quinone reductase
MMRAIVVRATGGPEALELAELPIPTPGPGQALIEIGYSGVNFVDIYTRTGLYKTPLPAVPGSEAAGVVRALASDVHDLSVGDHVAYAMTRGSYAEYAVVPADRLVRVPVGIEDRVAAAVMLQGMTAHYLARSTYPLTPNDTALVHAAAGGVGQLLVQIAKRSGARVIGTVSSEPKAAVARAAGADHVINYSAQDFSTEARRLTDGRGVSVVYDGVGAATWDGSLNALRPRGMLVSYGNASGPVPPIAPLVLSEKGSLFLTRPSLGAYIATRAELESRAQDLFAWIADGSLRVAIDHVYPLEDAAQAQGALEGRHTMGKVLLALHRQ